MSSGFGEDQITGVLLRRKPNRPLEQSFAIVSERGYGTTGDYSKRSSTLMLDVSSQALNQTQR